MTAPELPESPDLAAWARRVAPALTDVEWPHLDRVDDSGRPCLGGCCNCLPLDICCSCGRGRFNEAQAAALLAELDRIAGELSDEEYMLMVDNPTPLGRAVLQRVKEKR